MIIEGLLSTLSVLIDYTSAYTSSTKERRERISEFFVILADTLDDVITALRKSEVPHGKCMMLAEMSKDIPDLLSREIGEEEANEISQMMIEAHAVEMLLSEFKGDPSQSKKLIFLERSAGKLRALGYSLKVKN